MPRVLKPTDPTGRLGALGLPQRRATATPETFGAGIRNYAPGPEAFGGVTIAPHYEPAKSGFELLADTVAKVASIGSETAEKVHIANQETALQQSKLQARTEWTQANLAREATIEEGADPGEYAKDASAWFEEFKAKRLEGLSGFQKQAMEEDLGNLALHNLETATQYQAVRARQHREVQNKVTAAAATEQINSARNVVFGDPGQMQAVLAGLHGQIERAPGLADDVRAELRRDATGAMAQAMWVGKLERGGDPYSVREAMLRADPAELGGLEYGDMLQVLNGAEGKINQLETEARQRAAEAKAAQNAQIAALKLEQRISAEFLDDDGDKITKALEGGYSLAPEVVGGFVDQARKGRQSALDPDVQRKYGLLEEKIQTAVDTQDFTKAAARMPRLELERLVQQWRTEPLQAAVSVDQLQKAEKILADTQSAVREGRILSRGQELGLTQLEPVDLTNAASIANRVQQSRMIAHQFDSRVELFEPPEREQFAKMLQDMPGEQKADYLRTMQEAAGSNYADVIRELGVKGGLDPKTRYMAIVPPGSRIANAIGEALDADPKDLQANLTRHNLSVADVDTKVDAALRDWQDSVGPTFAQGSNGAQALIANVRETAKLTAMRLMLTMSPDEAVAAATNGIINDRYHYKSEARFGYGATQYRVPKLAAGDDAYQADLEAKMEMAKGALIPEAVEPPVSVTGVDEATRRANYLVAVQSKGRWATLPDESGVVLLDELGNVVTAAGKPVIVPF